MLVKSPRDRIRAGTGWRKARAALLGGAFLSLFAGQSVLAQQIVIDPSMIQGAGGGSGSDDGSAHVGSGDTDGSSSTPLAKVPAFQAGSISDAGKPDEITTQASEKTAVRPPARPSEFERYVAQTVGHPVKRYGQDLLLPAARDFAVPATSTIPGDYALNVGDIISINTVGSVEGSADFVINTNGEVVIPKIGHVKLVGVRYRDLHDRISDAFNHQYRGFEVTVSMKKLHGIRVYVTGFAQNPGAYSVNSLSTLVNAVMEAGGPNGGGSFRDIQLIRNGQVVRDFDLYEMLRQGNRNKDAILQNEDVLFIPPVGQQVAIVGSVNDEAIYEMKPGETLKDVMAIAGGPAQLADNSRAILYRLKDKDTVGSRQIALSDFAATPMEAGDIVQVLNQGGLARPIERQSVVVRIEGEVEKPGNYYVPAGTPLSKVMELAGGTTARAYPYGTKLLRETVRAQQEVALREAVDQLEIQLAAPNFGDRPVDKSSGQAMIDRLRRAQPDGRLVLSMPYAATSLPGDIVVENNDRIVVPTRVATVGVYGAVYRTASFMIDVDHHETLEQFLDRAGGPQRMADKSNIFIIRANGDVISRKRGGLKLQAQPGDAVFVPIKTQSSNVWGKIRDITSVIFNLGLGIAAIEALS
jgi:protein involved in polysaccharide export with SLBB domain